MTLKLAGLSLAWFGDCLLLGVLVFFAGGFLVVAHIFMPGWQGLCDVVTEFEPLGRTVWLTIDDGPDAEDTPQILDLLDAHRAKASFFMIGERAVGLREQVAEVRRRGHEVGCHTHSHPTRSFWCAGIRRVRCELDRALAVLNAPGCAVRRFRAPVGFKNLFLRSALRQRALTCVAWTIRSRDVLERESPEVVVRRVMSQVRPGAIILVHEGSHMPATLRVEVIRGLLGALQAEGYRCVIPGAAMLRGPHIGLKKLLLWRGRS